VDFSWLTREAWSLGGYAHTFGAFSLSLIVV